jgi:hypothetical protein
MRLKAPTQRSVLMRLLRCTSIFALLAIGFANLACAQKERDFPTDDEITLVLTQAERATQIYELQIEQEELLLGKNGKDSAVKDRQVLDTLKFSLKALKSKPQKFNGPIGFYFFEALDDASRNAVVSAAQVSSQLVTQLTEGNMKNGVSLLDFYVSCMDTSTLLYTVSENAGSLYQRYVKAEPQLVDYVYQTAKQCADVLKNKCAVPKK